MDIEADIEADIEDMLFGPDALHDDHDHASDVSDDDILDIVEGDEPNLRDLEDEPLLMPASTDHEGGEHGVQTAQSGAYRDKLPLLDAMRTVRDRWSTILKDYPRC
jgi:hypothetical protein